MRPSTITMGAALQPDGVTLRLEKEITVPPGRVTVTIQSAGAPPGPTMLEVLDRIHRDQQHRGQRSMTEEEMAAELERMQAEDEAYEERWRQIWSKTGKPDQTGG